MERQFALIFIIFIFILLYMMTYYGAQMTCASSIVFSSFVSLILLLLFYSPQQATQDLADFTLVIYGILLAVWLIILAFYIFYRTLMDVRERHAKKVQSHCDKPCHNLCQVEKKC